jgi:predicted dehydrogenase
VEAEIHYDRYVKELSYKAHKEVAVQGTGSLYDLGSHLIDQALQLFGWPQLVFADIRIVRPNSKVDDNFELILYYPLLRVRLRATYIALEPIPGYVLHGTNGSFLKPKTNIQEAALLAKKLPEGKDWGKEDESEWGWLCTEKDGKVTKEKVPSLQGQYMDYYDGIYNAIRLGQSAPVDAEEGLGVIKIIEAAFRSNEMGKVMAV